MSQSDRPTGRIELDANCSPAHEEVIRELVRELGADWDVRPYEGVGIDTGCAAPLW